MRASAESLTGSHEQLTGRLPDFFVVGHHKCGTTALYEMLKRHPQIFMSKIKEPRFFASDMRSRFQPTWGHSLPQTLEEYVSLFAGAAAEQRLGEATPSYLYSHTAAARIAEVQPRARSIAILREPASFLRSLHLQLLRSHVESEKDLRKAIALEEPRREGRHIPRRSHLPQLLDYSEHVRYVDQLRRYHAVFPRDQVLVLIYDDFRADNAATVRSVLRFLGVDETPDFEPIEVKHTARGMRSQRLDDLLFSVQLGRSPMARTARTTVKALMPRSLRHDALRTARVRGVYSDVPAADGSLMAELRRRYQPEVRALSEYLGRDLVTLWGYDELD
ncbi:MAG TPA: sulfotransferase [Solirubrobacteraceae bacterium]|nr:sulfotransferase [Solirubrobacteraceae bacterium]